MSREEKEKLVVDLYFNQGKTFRYIAEYLRLSPSPIFHKL
jgi:DNA-directed RNA polymerase specialized sigma subunit